MSAAAAPEESAQPIQGRLALTRLDWIIAAGIFLIALVLYVSTLAPDLLFGDSGEFQVLAVTGGLAHAFGYPVYLAIAKVFTYLPFRSVPERVSLVSAVFACSAVAKVFLISRSLGVRRVFSIIASVAIMVSPLFWWQCIIAEIYTISADFLIGFLLFAVFWRQTRDSRWLAAGGLLGGLCLGLHHAVLLSAPFVLVYLLTQRAQRVDWKFAGGGMFAGLALSLAAYMVMASIDSPPTATNYLRPVVSQYGLKSPDDLDSPLGRAKFTFFADQFRGDFQLAHFGPNISRVEAEIQDDFGWAIPLFALAGVVTLLTRRSLRKEGILLVGSYVVFLIVPMFLDAFDLEVEFIPAHLLMCVFAAFGLQGLQGVILLRRALERAPGLMTAAASLLLFALGSWRILAGVWPAFATRKPTFLTGVRRKFPYPVDNPTAVHDLAEAVVSNVPDKSLLLISWRYMDACYYVALFEDQKPDIDIVAGFPDAPVSPEIGNSIVSYYKGAARDRPLFSDDAPTAMDAEFKQTVILKGETGRVYLYRLIPLNPGG